MTSQNKTFCENSTWGAKLEEQSRSSLGRTYARTYDRRARRHEDGGLRFGRAPGPWHGLDLDLVVSLGGDQSKSCSPKMPPPH